LEAGPVRSAQDRWQPAYARAGGGALACDRRGAADAAFDEIYPSYIQAISRRFWTPVGVARQAAELFRQSGARHVLDVGAGVGKFVLVAAAAAPDVHFVGVEHRKQLVEIARGAQAQLQIPNAFFALGDATDMPWHRFQGFYFFNPLAENLFAADDQIDDAVELTESRFLRDVVRVERALRIAPLGAAVVTYHGMSGRMPACYELTAQERAGSDWLRLWVKKLERARGFYVESGDNIVLHEVDGSGV
jgi:SAM-dependent methyltransferase